MSANTRAWLYVPAVRPELFEKAFGLADGIVVDLEDAVHPAKRVLARKFLSQLDALPRTKPVVVRVNPVNGLDFARDIKALNPLLESGAVQAIRLAKTESRTDAEKAAAATRHWGEFPRLICLLESARAVKAADAIADVDGVQSMMLGEGDLRVSLGLPQGQPGEIGLNLARQHLVLSSRAAGLPAPIGAAYLNVSDLVGLEQTSTALKNMGFYGRSCIHPKQIPGVREAFRSTPEETDWAVRILEQARSMDTAQSASTTLGDGSFIDPAIIKHAEALLARSGS